MRRMWIGMVVLGMMMATPARLGGAETPAAKSATPTLPKKAVKLAEADAAKTADEKAPAREASAVEIELQQLKDLLLEQSRELEAQRALLREQQLKMEAMERQLNSARSSGTDATPEASPALAARVDAVATAQESLGQKVGQVEKEISETKKSVEGKLKSFGPFSFSGDLRLRFESAFDGLPLSGPSGEPQYRERYRLRLNANAKFNEEFSGGFSLASGDLNNPVSTNQTINQFYVRRTIGIDRAFVAYNPKWFKPFTITGGKFPYTWYRTQLAWDDDLNPEGLSEAAHWNRKDSFLQHVGIVALQLPFNSTFTASGASVSKVVPSAAMFGGQVQTNWKLHDRLKFGAYAGYYHYRNPDQLAQGQATGIIAGNGQTNFVGVISGSTLFASKWGILDTIARFDVDTGIARFPLMLLFNFAQNTRTCENLSAFTAAGVTPPFCNPRQRHAYWSEVQFGKTQEKGDARLGYTFMRIERDAVLSAWTFDDKRQATNVAQHRMEFFYQAYRQITLGFTGFFGKQLVTATSPTTTVAPEHFLKRFQLDLIYKF